MKINLVMMLYPPLFPLSQLSFPAPTLDNFTPGIQDETIKFFAPEPFPKKYEVFLRERVGHDYVESIADEAFNCESGNFEHDRHRLIDWNVRNEIPDRVGLYDRRAFQMNFQFCANVLLPEPSGPLTKMTMIIFNAS